MNIKPAHALAALAWFSVFMEAWLLIKGLIPSAFLPWFFWVFFLLVALISSAVSSVSPRAK